MSYPEYAYYEYERRVMRVLFWRVVYTLQWIVAIGAWADFLYVIWVGS